MPAVAMGVETARLRLEGAVEAPRAQAVLQHAILRPQQRADVEREGHVGCVVLVHAAAEAGGLRSDTDRDFGFPDKKDVLREPVEGGGEVVGGKVRGIEDALFVLEEFGKQGERRAPFNLARLTDAPGNVRTTGDESAKSDVRVDDNAHQDV